MITNEMRDFEKFITKRDVTKIKKIAEYIETKGDKIETRIYLALRNEVKTIQKRLK